MSWFERVTGFRETGYAETRDRLRVKDGRLMSEAGGPGHAVGELELVSLDALRARARGVTVPGRLTLGVAEGDVRRMHIEPENAGAVFQVASQFNLLEMVGPEVTPEDGVSGYAHDHTQGPACLHPCSDCIAAQVELACNGGMHPGEQRARFGVLRSEQHLRFSGCADPDPFLERGDDCLPLGDAVPERGVGSV